MNVQDEGSRRSILGAAIATIMTAVTGFGAEAAGRRCERCRRRGTDGPRCGRGLKCCGKECVDRGEICCGGAGYTVCPNGQTFRCANGLGECCNNGGQCNPATRAC